MLATQELAMITRADRRENRYTVDVYSDDGQSFASFNCSSEADARALRDAIRQHADSLRFVAEGWPC